MSIYLGGNDDQKQRYLKALCSGKQLGAWALTEPGAGSDAAHIRTTATRDGDSWLLNGSKMWITNGSFADVLVVFAATDRDQGARGVTANTFAESDALTGPGAQQRRHGRLRSQWSVSEQTYIRLPLSSVTISSR